MIKVNLELSGVGPSTADAPPASSLQHCIWCSSLPPGPSGIEIPSWTLWITLQSPPSLCIFLSFWSGILTGLIIHTFAFPQSRTYPYKTNKQNPCASYSVWCHENPKFSHTILLFSSHLLIEQKNCILLYIIISITQLVFLHSISCNCPFRIVKTVHSFSHGFRHCSKAVLLGIGTAWIVLTDWLLLQDSVIERRGTTCSDS